MQKKQILIIDDDEDSLTVLKKRLGSEGYECVCSSSIESALDFLSHSSPDLILLDLMFRGPNGTAFLQCAKERFWPDGDGPPVLVISGLQEADVVDMVLEMGASGFIAKPIDTSKLLSMIHRHVH